MTHKRSALTGNFLMIITAALWGFAFVAQKTGMDYLSPYMFSAIRFLIGATCLVFLLKWFGGARLDRRGYFWGIAMGLVLTFGVLMQQVGIVETTAGKGGFLTAIYILLVPIFLSFSGRRLALQIWPAALIVLVGLYFLSIKDGDFSSINTGDYWVLGSAIFWAAHLILIERAVKFYDPLRLSIVQFYTCGLLSLVAVLIFDSTDWTDVVVGIKGAWLELFYGGVASVAIAYTLQVFAQRSVPSHHAALILSLEAVFAVIGGVWLLNEELTPRMVMGFGLIFAGIILAQYDFKNTSKVASNETL